MFAAPILVTLTVFACLLASSPAPVTTPAPTPTPVAVRPATVTSLTLSTDQVDVSGLDTALVTIDVHLVSPDYDPDDARMPMRVNVVRSGTKPGWARAWVQAVTLSLASGTRRDGGWRGTYAFTSFAPGTWTVECVSVWRTQTVLPEHTPCADHPDVVYPSLTVTAHHPPSLTVAASPDPIGRGTKLVRLTGRLTDGETGDPLAGVPVHADTLGTCLGDNPSVVRTTTGPDGRYAVSADPVNGPDACVFVPARTVGVVDPNPVLHAATSRPLHFVPWVRGTVATPRVALRGTLRVITQFGYAYAPERAPGGNVPSLQLQRRTKGVWITVATLPANHYWTTSIRVRPDARGGTRGVQLYRLVLPAQERFTRAVSPVMKVRVT